MWMPALLFAALTGTAMNEAETRFVERARALAADEACEFLSPAERAQLETGLRLSRQNLELAGLAPDTIEQALARIRTDRALAACDSAAIAAISSSARSAAVEIARTAWIELDGVHHSWNIDRTEYEFVRWPLVQQIGEARFGRAVVSERGPERVVEPALVLPGAGDAVSAVLIVRDAAALPAPYDRTREGLFALPDADPVARFSPPPHARKRYFASGRISEARARRLLTDGERASEEPAFGFTFPERALEAIAALAPQESAIIELMDGRGVTVHRLYVEAGYLKSALDFSALAYQPAMASR